LCRKFLPFAFFLLTFLLLIGPASAQKMMDKVYGQAPWQLARGEYYFRVNGVPTLVFGRNLIGNEAQFVDYFQQMAQAGERLVRIHLTQSVPWPGPAGEVDAAWAARWERIFDQAAQRGLAVIPVLGVWVDWNNGSNQEAWHDWEKNPFNAALGGPAATPADLFADTPCQQRWLTWVRRLVTRWQSRPEIVAWEIFSEVDLVTGATEASAAAFVTNAARVIRAADGMARPLTVSMSGVKDWPLVFGNPAIEITQVHPYAEVNGGFLSDLLLVSVHERLRRYGKPVLLGESGLDARPPGDTLTTAERAPVGIRHGIWAGMVSGALNARMLWWEDSYYPPIVARYQEIAAPAARFVCGMDFTGVRPVEAVISDNLRGAAVGNARFILAWFRDAWCNPPTWPVRKLSHEIISFPDPGGSPSWQVQYVDPASGKLIAQRVITPANGRLVLTLPTFQDAIGIKVVARADVARASSP